MYEIPKSVLRTVLTTVYAFFRKKEIPIIFSMMPSKLNPNFKKNKDQYLLFHPYSALDILSGSAEDMFISLIISENKYLKEVREKCVHSSHWNVSENLRLQKIKTFSANECCAE